MYSVRAGRDGSPNWTRARNGPLKPKIGGRQNGSPRIKRGARNGPMGPGRDAVKSSFTAPTA
jgi:hypothetical protein